VEMTCKCDEGFMYEGRFHNLRKIRIDAQHDCEYIKNRNKLIPLAEAEANKHVGPGDRRFGDGLRTWTRVFLEEMDRLWAIASKFEVLTIRDGRPMEGRFLCQS